jgi:GNAT superfamily N-acetyltransferase
MNVSLSGYVPGAIGRIVELHARYYHEHWGFGLYFECKVATELSEFLCRLKEGRDGFWIAMINGNIAGSIAVDGIKGSTKGAHLRWFIVAPEHHRKGIGGRLLGEAVEFCKKRNYPRIHLWTFEGLHPARHLYEKLGFKLCEEHEGTQWGKAVTEQMFELRL